MTHVTIVQSSGRPELTQRAVEAPTPVAHPICSNEPNPQDWVLLIKPDYGFNQIPIIHAE